MGDTESCSSRVFDSSLTRNRQHKQKVNIYNEVLHRLMDLNVAESTVPGFEDELWAHFYRLPTGYAQDVNVERAQDVLMHKKLLQLAHDPATRPAFEVHLASALGSQERVEMPWSYASKQSIHPQPAFDLSPDLRHALEANQLCIQNFDQTMNSRPMHEITISTNDQPKLFCQLTSVLSEVGLNIQEAHAFSTIDGYSLDVFLVDGWALEETEQLKVVLAKKIPRIEHPRLNQLISPVGEAETGMKLIFSHAEISNDGSEVRDVDLRLLKFEKKIASGSCSDLYKGTFYNQEVAIKVFRTEHLNETIQREFAQEVDIMRKVQHKNVVQFIGASTRPPSLCIVTEFMSGGSLYDFLQQSGVLPLQFLLRVAIDVSNGMNYLHQNNIIHRDLKAANLLMDENGVVKVSDFGVARVQAQSGVMTAETGTYRWMAPEVIEHRPYDQKADVFSFGIMLWELLTGKLPYENLTPLQAAVGVVHKGLRPTIEEHTDPMLVELMESCWQREPSLRPQFSEILEILQSISNRKLIVLKQTSDPRVCKQKEKVSRIVPSFRHGRGPSAK
ncbi:serine/threonine-protein kinase STY46-like isoform X2 [Humulus lupulus]|uniref:serine/threonine-protein kinase STY46-like isoform X2 n=1 Tax=Humulus lupulus TaxID=3486 RepID=UPI002B40ECBD|nr:serine/threonine-protein kinase STY46-like isoform X2 [Humulus lupulus]